MTSESAVLLCRDLQTGQRSAVEWMNITYDRIESINPTVNALVNLIPREQALQLATQADQVPVAQRGPLHGLPMAPKDAVDVAGLPTTQGFRPWQQRIAAKDDAQAARLRAAGALFIGHSNMPEFGLGSQTFNQLFGATRNPYDLDKTCGGSSGGAATALATHMLALADGSDMGGSLRNPASFCNVVGLRPSIGRTPPSPGMSWFGRLVTTGPMARTVSDAALLFSVQAGPYASDPLTLAESGESFLDAWVADSNLKHRRIAFSTTLCGAPVAPEVADVVTQAARVFSNLGAEVVEDAPPLDQAMSVFKAQRAAGLSLLGEALDQSVPDWQRYAKDTARENIEQGRALSRQQLLKSELSRSRLYHDAVSFMSQYDAFVLPAAQVTPFSIDVDWVRDINGHAMQDYLEWMTVCCAITVTGFPALSLPAGFSSEGLPVGLQIVGQPRGDLALLKLAHAFEQATEHHQRKPPICAV